MHCPCRPTLTQGHALSDLTGVCICRFFFFTPSTHIKIHVLLSTISMAEADVSLPTLFPSFLFCTVCASNHDGYLTKSEFVALVNEWGRSSFLGPELFEKHDHNRDGLLSRGDFLSLVRQESSAGASAQQREWISFFNCHIYVVSSLSFVVLTILIRPRMKAFILAPPLLIFYAHTHAH